MRRDWGLRHLCWRNSSRVINNFIEAGTNNPLFLLDEIDKIGSSFGEILHRTARSARSRGVEQVYRSLS